MLGFGPVLFFMGCGSPSANPLPDITPKGSILLQDSSTTAGEPVDIYALFDSDSITGTWTILWTDAFGETIMTLPQQGGTIKLPIPEQAFKKTGMVQLTLCHNEKIIDKQQLEIKSGPPFGVVESYAGAKTMVVGSSQTAMEIVIPKDQFGNPMPDGHEVRFNYSYPGKQPEVKDRQINNMIAAITFGAGENDGNILIGASSGKAMAIEETIELTPAWPSAFIINLITLIPYADPRQNIIIRSNTITDTKGNKVSDGTVVHFTVLENDLTVAQFRGFTSNGIVEVYIQNPDHTADWEIKAVVAGDIKSNTIALGFEAYVQQMPITYNPAKKILVVGPVTGHLGQMVTDDLPIEVTVSLPSTSLMFSGKTDNGFCNLDLPSDFPKGNYDYSIKAGGRNLTGKLNIK